MKHKVSELEGALLDAAVAKAEGREVRQETYGISEGQWLEHWPTHWYWIRVPSRTWADGGPIIECEQINVVWEPRTNEWVGTAYRDGAPNIGLAPTPLIAAMRAYVASKLGEEVELP